MVKSRGGPGQVIINYVKGTRAELRRVNWPDRQEATRLTIMVLAVTFSMAVLLGLIDFIFAKLFGLVI